MPDFLDLALRSAAVYLFLIAGIILLGKKELAQLSVSDLVFFLLVSNALQNAMVGPDNSLIGGIVSATVLIVINYVLKQLIFRIPALAKVIKGDPLILVYKGKVNTKNLEKESISMDELLAAVREHGLETLQDVKLSILETDGTISVISTDKQTVHQRPFKI